MTIGTAFPCPVGSIYGQQRRVKLVNIFVALGGLGWWVAPWVSGWMGGREEEGEGTHLHFPDWESQGGETTHSLWNPGRSLGWIVDVFLRSTQPPSIFCIWRPLMLPSNGRWEGGERLGAFRKVRTFLGLVALGGHHHENSVMLFLLPLRGW